MSVDVDFGNPVFLIVTAVVPFAALFWAFLRARREKELARLVAPSLRSRLMPKRTRFGGLQSFLIVSGLFLTLFAAARPKWGDSHERIVERSRNVVVAIDVSKSMLTEDVWPNKLGRTKWIVNKLIDSLEGDRCALVAFRHKGVVLCPLTSDRGFLRRALEQVSTDAVAPGKTDLGSGIRAALEALDPAADDHNAIILISDGGKREDAGDALANAALAVRRHVPVFTVGIGDSKKASPIPIVDARGKRVMLTHQGKPVLVKLEEEVLKDIAVASHGDYVALGTAATDKRTLDRIYQKFRRQVEAEEQVEIDQRKAEQYALFLVPGLALLLAGAMLSKGRFRSQKTSSSACNKP